MRIMVSASAGMSAPAGVGTGGATGLAAAGGAALNGQLGYPASAAEITRRFAGIALRDDVRVFVASEEDRVVGWAHVYLRYLLESEGEAD